MMEFVAAPDDLERTGMTNRLVSRAGLIEIGVVRVMYGYRVRSGFCGDFGCQLDWCGGARWSDVERLYAIARTILAAREETTKCFAGIPRYSEVKPFFNDPEFVSHVVGLVTATGLEFEVQSLKRPNDQAYNAMLELMFGRDLFGTSVRPGEE